MERLAMSLLMLEIRRAESEAATEVLRRLREEELGEARAEDTEQMIRELADRTDLEVRNALDAWFDSIRGTFQPQEPASSQLDEARKQIREKPASVKEA